MAFPFWLFATFNRNSNKSIQDVVVFLFRKSIYVRLRKTTLLRIVYCHFLASCTSRFVFRLGTKSNNAQKKRYIGELSGSASVQTVYIFFAIFYLFPPFLFSFILFPPFRLLYSALFRYLIFPFHILLYSSAAFIFLSLVITSIPFSYLLYIPLCTFFILCPYSFLYLLYLPAL